MTVETRIRADVGVKTWTKATLYVTNEVLHIWVIILQQRGLSNKEVLSKKELLSNGLLTWLLTHHLRRACLEMYQDSSDRATERWDLVFRYADPHEDVDREEDVDAVWRTYLDEISGFMRKLDALHQGTAYRVVVDLADGVEGQWPPEVEGWSRTTFRRADHLSQHKFGDVIDANGKVRACAELGGQGS